MIACLQGSWIVACPSATRVRAHPHVVFSLKEKQEKRACPNTKLFQMISDLNRIEIGSNADIFGSFRITQNNLEFFSDFFGCFRIFSDHFGSFGLLSFRIISDHFGSFRIFSDLFYERDREGASVTDLFCDCGLDVDFPSASLLQINVISQQQHAAAQCLLPHLRLFVSKEISRQARGRVVCNMALALCNGVHGAGDNFLLLGIHNEDPCQDTNKHRNG